MDKLMEYLKKKDYKKVRTELESRLIGNDKNIDILLKLALINLEPPWHNDDIAIEYLNRVIEADPYNFYAVCIKSDLQFFYNKIDELEKLKTHIWKTPYETAVAYFIVSWQYRVPWEYEHEKEKIKDEIVWLDKSVSEYSKLVYPYKRKGYINTKLKRNKAAADCYRLALQNVVSTDYSYMDAISPQAYIDEYITGTRLSDINFKRLKEDFNEVSEQLHPECDK